MGCKFPHWTVMFRRYHQWLPIVLAIYLPVCCFITYGIAVANNHVEPVFPYISDAGSLSPESCVFGQLLNIGAFLALTVVYHRYRQIVELLAKDPEIKWLKYWNNFTSVLGVIMCLGVSVVANFQVSNVIVVHYIGAFMAFVVGFFYCVCQTVISFTINKVVQVPGNTGYLKVIRVILCIVDFCFIAICITLHFISVSQWIHSEKSQRLWSEEDPGYSEHVTATVTEWLIAFTTVVFIATYYSEFRHFRISAPKIDYTESTNNMGNEDAVTTV